MAFPTQGILDAFTRADNASLGTNWTNKVFTTDLNPRIASNQAGPDTDSGNSYCSAYWNVATFGIDSECFCTVSVLASNRHEFYCRLTSPGTSSVAGFAFAETFGTANEWGLYEITAGVSTALCAKVTQSYSSGDRFGIEAIGSTIQGYYAVGAGSFTSII